MHGVFCESFCTFSASSSPCVFLSPKYSVLFGERRVCWKSEMPLLRDDLKLQCKSVTLNPVRCCRMCFSSAWQWFLPLYWKWWSVLQYERVCWRCYMTWLRMLRGMFFSLIVIWDRAWEYFVQCSVQQMKHPVRFMSTYFDWYPRQVHMFNKSQFSNKWYLEPRKVITRACLESETEAFNDTMKAISFSSSSNCEKRESINGGKKWSIKE